MKQIKKRHIELAIAVTRTRWVALLNAKSKTDAKSIINFTNCGFCDLDGKVEIGKKCLSLICPIGDDTVDDSGNSTCCQEWRTACKSSNPQEIHEAAKSLLARIDTFNIPKIVKDINEALRKAEE